MPDLIQFECPSCAAMLRIPLEMGGEQGPCPLCDQEIIAPDPHTGAPAREPELTQEPPAHDEIIGEPPPENTFHKPNPDYPFADRVIGNSQPVPDVTATTEPPIEPSASPPTNPPEPRPAGIKRSGILLACSITALVALAAGFFLGNQLRPAPATVIRPPKKILPETPVTPPPPPAETVASPPPLASSQPPDNLKIVAGAEAALKAFLEAPDWSARSVFVLSPETVKPKMEAYAKSNPDGPTNFKSLSVKHSQIDEKTQSTLLIFQVDTENTTGGIPVAVLETPKGWLVDWESFVEFRDDHFKYFTEGPPDLSGDFHLIVSKPQETSGQSQENENFASFLLSAPLSERPTTAFIKKSNPDFPRLRAATDIGICTPVLQITKKTTGDGRTYLEILSMKATDWRPKEPSPGP